MLHTPKSHVCMDSTVRAHDGTTTLKPSFVEEYATKCPALALSTNGHAHIKKMDATTTVDQAFVLWGFISAFFVLTAYTAMLPVKSEINVINAMFFSFVHQRSI